MVTVYDGTNGNDFLGLNPEAGSGPYGVFDVYGMAGNDTITGSAGDTIHGGSGNDVLWAGPRGNQEWLLGDGGNDTLETGGGSGLTHTLTGGAGADLFILGRAFGWDSGMGSVDYITDFSYRQGDRIVGLAKDNYIHVTQVGHNVDVIVTTSATYEGSNVIQQIVLDNVRLSSLHSGWIS